ncbi:MAG: TIGR02453 family protein [Thermodesulfobacteriota bacterium]|nr:MAG: TIGR02453 family protein [Thermodesulfobacteriota bacterium]
MTDKIGFKGFSNKTLKFFKDLEENNTRQWFEENRVIFEKNVMEPAQEFVMEMGERLKPLCPKIVAIPKTDKSIFRIYRDVRFSKDKTPYKTHLGIFLWEGPRKKLGNPGFYLQLDKSQILIAGGIYQLPNELVKPYRDAVSDSKRGTEVAKILKKITKNSSYKLGGSHYKRVPRGYDPDSPNAELLLHNGLYLYYEGAVPKEVYSSDFLDYALGVFKDIMPLHIWIRDNVSN